MKAAIVLHGGLPGNERADERSRSEQDQPGRRRHTVDKVPQLLTGINTQRRQDGEERQRHGDFAASGHEREHDADHRPVPQNLVVPYEV